jgi:hypothetical protein
MDRGLISGNHLIKHIHFKQVKGSCLIALAEYSQDILKLLIRKEMMHLSM